MRATKKNITKPRKEKLYESESFKNGKFTEEELKQYGLCQMMKSLQSLNIRHFYLYYKKKMKIG